MYAPTGKNVGRCIAVTVFFASSEGVEEAAASITSMPTPPVRAASHDGATPRAGPPPADARLHQLDVFRYDHTPEGGRLARALVAELATYLGLDPAGPPLHRLHEDPRAGPGGDTGATSHGASALSPAASALARGVAFGKALAGQHERASWARSSAALTLPLVQLFDRFVHEVGSGL